MLTGVVKKMDLVKYDSNINYAQVKQNNLESQESFDARVNDEIHNIEDAGHIIVATVVSPQLMIEGEWRDLQVANISYYKGIKV